MPKLKEQARRFAAICEAPLAAVPTLDEYLAGRNIPAAKTQLQTQPSPAARPQREPMRQAMGFFADSVNRISPS